VNRRQLITLLGGAAVWPAAVQAQRAKPVVGFLFVGSSEASSSSAFNKGLSEMGFVEGENLTIEYRWGENQSDRLSAFAAELVRRKVAVICAAGGTSAAEAAKTATTTIPVVFSIGDDPVEAGLVASFNRPGANVTGISFMNAQLTAKRIGLLHELVPAAQRFAMLAHPGNVAAVTAEAQAAVATIGREIEVFIRLHKQFCFQRRCIPRRRAAEQRDELASFHHSITSSARARADA
jgi:ABC-type uncharacterized transport system substrate-binding protein